MIKEMENYKLKTTTLHQSPFSILGATTRDNRQRIVQLAEIGSLEIDHDVSQKARSTLTNPRTRVRSEMSWLPGVSPKQATEYLQTLLDAPMEIRFINGIPVLANLNLLSVAFEAIDENHDPNDLIDFILKFAIMVDTVNVESVMRDINNDRVVAGFPLIQSLSKVEEEFINIQQNYLKVIKNCVNRFHSKQVILIMTDLLYQATLNGTRLAPQVIDELVLDYKSETEGVLEDEADKIHLLIDGARMKVIIDSDEQKITPIVDLLDVVVRHWDYIAQPIQLSAMARGTHHVASKKVVRAIRNLAYHLFTNHGMLHHAQNLIALLQELFPELPEESDMLGKDAQVLAEIQARLK